MDESIRKKKYDATFHKKYNISIFNLDYKHIEPWIPRDYASECIKTYYNLNYLLTTNINIKCERKGMFNLSKIRKYNVFYNMYLGISKERNYDDYFFNFIIKIGEIEICRISNRGSEIVDFGKILFHDHNYNYYPICLFECFEKKFRES